MRFHLTMFFMVIAVSLGMHAMASAAPADAARVADINHAAAAFPSQQPLTCATASHGGH